MPISPALGAIAYTPAPDEYDPYHYEDEVVVVPLLGRDGALADRNEVLQTSAKRAQVCTFAALVTTAAERNALQALWATQTTHDDGSGEAVRNVTVVKMTPKLLLWSGTFPVTALVITVRTR